jgi:hypothetical protein
MGEDRKRVRVDGANLAELIGEIAEVVGVEVVDADATGATVDLVVLETSSADEVAASAARASAPILVVAPRRLRAAAIDALVAAGAARVMDAEASVLDVLCSFCGLLFGSYSEQRRYRRQVGGFGVRFRRLGEPDAPFDAGRIVSLARSGGFVEITHRLPEGARVEMGLEIAGRVAPIRGRVAFTRPDGFALEFELGDRDVAPDLGTLCLARVATA